MNLNTHPLHHQIFLHSSSHTNLNLTIVNISLTKEENKLTNCHITFCINSELYSRIINESLFNLKPEALTNETLIDFDSTLEIYIEASVHPHLLSQLTESATNINNIANYLTSVNQSQPNHPLFFTENWFILEVKQIQDQKEVGYRTFWNYISPSILVKEDISQSQISTVILKYFQDLTNDNLPKLAEIETAETITEISKLLEELANIQFQNIAEETTAELVGVMAKSLQQWSDENRHGSYKNDQSIFANVIAFFEKDDWQFRKIDDEDSLLLAFEGDNGRWNCYAKVREEQKQFVFYSICPVQISEDKRLTIAEFITRANYGMINGNFEMDFNDGEIRYKTSIDVDGDQLSYALIKNLVYANVTMMDEYLPGIINIIESDIYPELAINKIEQNQEVNQSSDQIEQLPLIIAVDAQKEDLKTQERNPYILAILTPEEIAQFHHALQVLPPYQHKQADAIFAERSCYK
ncbi:YbjN domain-containing protein [Anabaena sp. UHCC 0204]|uniref:YbjN domain-containing protein n=2 Tax=unclassified Anabaena TaxID=2619674 RepID=UPI0014489847|nr:YbjN domain-containing protein [Anabaena sp. UHCC 0204]